MNTTEQREAIAKACGWTIIDFSSVIRIPPRELIPPQTVYWDTRRKYKMYPALPDYLNDLNAMHEAESAVIFADSALSEEYGMRLGKSYHPPWFLEVTGSQLAAICHTTAAQRAEAFLRTLNLWKD